MTIHFLGLQFLSKFLDRFGRKSPKCTKARRWGSAFEASYQNSFVQCSATDLSSMKYEEIQIWRNNYKWWYKICLANDLPWSSSPLKLLKLPGGFGSPNPWRFLQEHQPVAQDLRGVLGASHRHLKQWVSLLTRHIQNLVETTMSTSSAYLVPCSLQ